VSETAGILNGMPDALAASALVTAVVAALFSLWQPEVQTALDSKESDDPGNWGETADIVRSALRSRACPLAITASATSLILVPRAIGIFIHALGSACGLRCYDDVQAMFLLTEGLMLALAVVTLRQIGALTQRLRKLSNPPKQP
jgi:hypothetical protein